MNINNFKLRKARKKEFKDFYLLKKEDRNVFWSGFSTEPDIIKLQVFFNKAIENNQRDFYLFYENDQVVGYIYIDYDKNETTAEISYAISESQKSRGLAKIMISMALKKIKRNITQVIAWVASKNIASIKTIIPIGFEASLEKESRVLAQEPSPMEFIKYIKKIY